ncbi:MAG: phytoene desaturase family protein [Mucilaginibacter sp.]
MIKNRHVIVIGAGFSGLAAAALMAKAGHKVILLEKNASAGGRARMWEKDGFRFDMGPSWYWMPEVFENYFALFDKKISDFYQLKRLDPSYRIFFGKNDQIDVPARMNELGGLFEQLEPGSSERLNNFLADANFKYRAGMGDLVFKPSHSIAEYLDPGIIGKSFRLQLFTSMHNHVRRYFSDPRLIKLLEFPVLFLGGTPQTIPAMYSMMNYADLVLGTWYPMGGMYEIVKAMVKIAEANGVGIHYDTEVSQIEVKDGQAVQVHTKNDTYSADVAISGADYEHTDSQLLNSIDRNYSADYWEKRTLSPSALIFYIGLNKKVKGINHHNLFFDEDFEQHAAQIYNYPQWPEKPLFYVCCPSKTDNGVGPPGCENLFFLMPVAPGLVDTDAIRETYFDILMNRFEQITGENIRDSIIVKRSYAINDFKADYNSYKGNAYGLANILKQTAFLKPKMRSKKVRNLFYTGQLTVPGPGVPPAIISGQIVANEALKYLAAIK